LDRLIRKQVEAGAKQIHTLTPARSDTPRVRELLLADHLRLLTSNAEIRSLAPVLDRMRMTKSAAELAMLQRAIDATGAAQARVARTLRPGVWEYELEAEILGAFLRYGAERASFSSIVGSGVNATTLHYDRNRKQIEDGDLVVVDIGAEYSYYAADITRTYPASGMFTPRQRQIYELVLEAQRVCAEAVKPGGTHLGSLTDLAAEVFRKSPLRARDEQGNERTLDYFFFHATSHYLGMDVHDVADYGRVLQPGDVLTIEPGLYIPREKIGVRIEDDYLVTRDGLKKLSAAIPSQPAEIELALRGASAPGR
ncbi:MAG: M24 family metallopeptidase, partial [Blastocatellia bacterium]